MPSKESLAVALPMVCKRFQWSEATPSAFVMEWANAVTDLLDEAVLAEAECWYSNWNIDDSIRDFGVWAKARLAQLREGKT